jgi:cytidylate kinase
LHTPCDLDNETQLHSEIKNWLAFAKQKVNEVIALKELSEDNPKEKFLNDFEENKKAVESRNNSSLIHNQQVKQRVSAITEKDSQRKILSEFVKMLNKNTEFASFSNYHYWFFSSNERSENLASKIQKRRIICSRI